MQKAQDNIAHAVLLPTVDYYTQEKDEEEEEEEDEGRAGMGWDGRWKMEDEVEHKRELYVLSVRAQGCCSCCCDYIVCVCTQEEEEELCFLLL